MMKFTIVTMNILFFFFTACSGGGSNPTVPPIPITAFFDSGTFVDGNLATGINKDTTKDAVSPHLTVFNSKLYATWDEIDGAANQIRVAVYNGNDASPFWTFVDGNGANGINKNTANNAVTPTLTVFNSKLYAKWRETNGGIRQIRVAVYNGNDASPLWTFVDGNGANGINRDTTRDTLFSPAMAVFNSKLYAQWDETDGTAQQIRVAVYNGNDGGPSWAFVDGDLATGINKEFTQAAVSSSISVFNSKLYTAWRETDGAFRQIRVAVYNGNDGAPSWAFIDGNGTTGINKDTTNDAFVPKLRVFNSKLYATWRERDGALINHIRVAVYNGDDASPAWTFVDGNGTTGINKDSTMDTAAPELTDFSSKLYATWTEDDGTTAFQVRMAVYSGDDASPSWTFVDGNAATGINKDTTRGAIVSQLIEFNSKLYASWDETDGLFFQIRVKAGNNVTD